MFLLVPSAFVTCDSLIVFTQFFLHELINNAFIRKINVVIHAKLILFVKEQLMKSRSKKRIQILYMWDVESLLESFIYIIIIKSAEFDQYDASACIHLISDQ